MADFPALPLWTDRYLADTRHLKRDQHGAYLLLLMEAWRRPGCSLPDDDEILATLACASAEEWNALKPVIMAFWELDGRGKVWRQKRLTSERLFVERKRVQNRDKAVDRWKRTKNQDATAMQKDMPNGCQTPCQTDAPTPTKKERKKKEENGGASPDLAGEPKALFSDEEIASAKLAYSLVRLDEELPRLERWAGDNWPNDQASQRRKIFASLANKQSALEKAKGNLADRDKGVTVTPQLLASRLVRATP
jgi:uncharacterized protein YdaU (DUF1376 family)